MVDNVCRPFFMAHSTQMPLPIMLIGVVGGLLAFGMIGIFIGPPIVGIMLHLYRSHLRQLE
jgi:predicted PurR-regulated permease PerM